MYSPRTRSSILSLHAVDRISSVSIRGKSLKNFLGVGMFELRGPFGKRVVSIGGGRGRVVDVDGLLKRLAAIDQTKGTTSQIFDASLVAGVEHLVHAARSALIAHATKNNFASSLGVELVCWVAAERQIARAFEKVGVHQGDGELALLTVGTSRAQVKTARTEIFRELAIRRDDRVLELKHEKFSSLQKAFSISQKELEVAPAQKLVLERIALLALAK